MPAFRVVLVHELRISVRDSLRDFPMFVIKLLNLKLVTATNTSDVDGSKIHVHSR